MAVKPAAFALDPLDSALALIATAGDEPPRLAELAHAVGLSLSHLQRAFRKRFGVSPAEYAQSRKLQLLKSALRAAPRVTDAIYDAGYGSGSRVYEKTGQLLGMTPANYRRGGAGIAIRYTTLQIPLGYLLVAASERGICTVTLGDSEQALIAGLRAEFPLATCERVDDGVAFALGQGNLQFRKAAAQNGFDSAINTAWPECHFSGGAMLFEQGQHAGSMRDVADVHGLPRGAEQDADGFARLGLQPEAGSGGDGGMEERAAVHAGVVDPAMLGP